MENAIFCTACCTEGFPGGRFSSCRPHALWSRNASRPIQCACGIYPDVSVASTQSATCTLAARCDETFGGDVQKVACSARAHVPELAEKSGFSKIPKGTRTPTACFQHTGCWREGGRILLACNVLNCTRHIAMQIQANRLCGGELSTCKSCEHQKLISFITSLITGRMNILLSFDIELSVVRDHSFGP